MSQTPLLRAYDEVVAFFARGPSSAEIAAFRLSDETIARVRDLLRKNSAGTLTPDESDELDQCVQLDRMMLLIRSPRLVPAHAWEGLEL
jgi:hypothetical protein